MIYQFSSELQPVAMFIFPEMFRSLLHRTKSDVQCPSQHICHGTHRQHAHGPKRHEPAQTPNGSAHRPVPFPETPSN